MDQVKIGKFIAHMRKQNDLTQKKLAQKLGISDKTVSKWECGKGMPDNALLLPLCESLGITVNELLSGECLSDNGYGKKAEENIVSLLVENEEIQKKGRHSRIIYIVGELMSVLLPVFVLLLSAGFGRLQHFIDIPALTIITAMVLLVLMATRSAGIFIRALRIGFSRECHAKRDEIRAALLSVRLVSAAVILSGAACGIMECIVVAISVDVEIAMRYNVAVVGVTILYSLLILLLLLPLRHRLEMLLYREESMGIR